MEKIEGAKLIGKTWHYYKRIPKRLVEAYGLPEFKRGSMHTKDPDKAKQLARAMLAELDELAAKLDSVSERAKVFGDLSPKEQDRLESDIARNVKALPADQRQLVQKAGGVWGAGAAMRTHETLAAFQKAGLGADYALKDDMGEEYDPDHREREEVRDVADINLDERKGKALRDALTAADVIEPTADAVTGLRSLMEQFCEAKGYVHTAARQNKTRRQYEYAVRRFIEYHGDLPVADMEVAHLSSFSRDFLKLPVSSRKDIRPLAFWDAVRAADAEGLPRADPRTRDQNLTLLKALMAYAVREGKRPAPNPWDRYVATVAKQTVGARRARKPYSFSRDEMNAIIAHVRARRDPSTVDFWAPLIGAHHGMRLEEVCQLHVADFTTEEGYACVGVTDDIEGGGDKSVKTENSYRIIPLHPKLLELGLNSFVERRRQAGAGVLFMEAERHSGALHDILPDRDGRYGTNYGSRFRDTELKRRLGMKGNRIGFHSFRHGWTDLARNTGEDGSPMIAYEHRLALAGRDTETGERILDGTERRYGHGFSIKVLAAELAKIKVMH
ncbi:hypothetical protein D6850_12935 [Roseovarius spongiae]|uniref:DUF6538 domain-containing protein n=1 Tax=Roseovarius spongiae TaxID=2320272 RepID=A0A3A8ATS5_9RHOB|nr:DUF6538 domain-containing protein [Roseovarius spongiae]RKF14070.1 hypothetical protein D6850_12935 [Roseovarius spongiae]